MRVAALFCLTSALAFADDWSGFLVDSKCYDALERNVNPTDTMTSVDRDRNWEIRYCSPKPKAKLFAVVQESGQSFKLDSVGDAKAIELVRKTGKRTYFEVDVTGEMSGDTVKVDSISAVE